MDTTLALLNPSPAIPPEILRLIFVYCHDMWQKDKSSRNPGGTCFNPRMALMYIASVCQYWRQVVLDTSELWATCWLCYTHPELNRMWLSRAGMRALNIDGSGIRMPTQGSSNMTTLLGAQLGSALASITPYMPQCHTLRIALDVICDSKMPLSQVPFQKWNVFAPNLEVCTLLIGRRGPVPSWMLDLILASPKLRDLFIDWDEQELNPVIPNFSRLGVLCSDLKRLQQILTKAKNLQTHRPKKQVFTTVFSPGISPVVHPSLTCLELEEHRLYDALQILSAMTLPSLATLSFRATNNSNLNPLFSLLERSQCALEDISIFRTATDSFTEYIPILSHRLISSSLKVLRCSFAPITEQFVRFLSEPSNLPSLRKLILENSIIQVDFSLIGDMILARCGLDGKSTTSKKAPQLEYFRLTAASQSEELTKSTLSRTEIQRVSSAVGLPQRNRIGAPLVLELWDE